MAACTPPRATELSAYCPHSTLLAAPTSARCRSMSSSMALAYWRSCASMAAFCCSCWLRPMRTCEQTAGVLRRACRRSGLSFAGGPCAGPKHHIRRGEPALSAWGRAQPRPGPAPTSATRSCSFSALISALRCSSSATSALCRSWSRTRRCNSAARAASSARRCRARACGQWLGRGAGLHSVCPQLCRSRGLYVKGRAGPHLQRLGLLRGTGRLLLGRGRDGRASSAAGLGALGGAGQRVVSPRLLEEAAAAAQGSR